MQNTPTGIHNIIKINADLGAKGNIVDSNAKGSIHINRLDSVIFEISLLNKGIPADLSDISRIDLELLDIGDVNTPIPRTAQLLLSKSVSAEGFNIIDSQSYSAGAYHVAIALDESETSFEAGIKWLKICAVSVAGYRTTFANGWIYFDESYTDAVPQINSTPDIFLRESQAQAIFAAREKNLSDLASSASARNNLDVFSKSETLSNISESLITCAPSEHTHLQYENSEATLTQNIADLEAKILNDKIESQSVKLDSCNLSIKRKDFATVPFTFAFFYKKANSWTNGVYFITASLATGSNVNGFEMATGTPNANKFFLRTNRNTGYSTMVGVRITDFPVDGKWHSVILTCASKFSADMNIYVDGIDKTTFRSDGTFDGNFDSTAPIIFNAPLYSNLSVAKIRIHNRVWSQDEIYAYSKGGEVDDESAILKLSDTADSLQIKDLSPKSNYAILSSNAVATKCSNPCVCSDKISWVDTKTSQYICGGNAIAANSKITLFAKSDQSANFVFAANSVSKSVALVANKLTEISDWIFDANGSISATPATNITGTLEVFFKSQTMK